MHFRIPFSSIQLLPNRHPGGQTTIKWRESKSIKSSEMLSFVFLSLCAKSKVKALESWVRRQMIQQRAPVHPALVTVDPPPPPQLVSSIKRLCTCQIPLLARLLQCKYSSAPPPRQSITSVCLGNGGSDNIAFTKNGFGLLEYWINLLSRSWWSFFTVFLQSWNIEISFSQNLTWGARWFFKV